MMIHVRFAPNGAVTEISERPDGATPQDWFDHLTRVAGTTFQALSGGRGLFRIPDADVEAIKASAAS
jgi:hypothetical protein